MCCCYISFISRASSVWLLLSLSVAYDNLRASGRLFYATLRLGTLDSTSVVEWLSKDTNVSYQVYKRVWPATQRESLFWSTIRHCPAEDEEGPDYWIVTNHSTEHPDAPVSQHPFVVTLQRLCTWAMYVLYTYFFICDFLRAEQRWFASASTWL